MSKQTHYMLQQNKLKSIENVLYLFRKLILHNLHKNSSLSSVLWRSFTLFSFVLTWLPIAFQSSLKALAPYSEHPLLSSSVPRNTERPSGLPLLYCLLDPKLSGCPEIWLWREQHKLVHIRTLC